MICLSQNSRTLSKVSLSVNFLIGVPILVEVVGVFSETYLIGLYDLSLFTSSHFEESGTLLFTTYMLLDENFPRNLYLFKELIFCKVLNRNILFSLFPRI